MRRRDFLKLVGIGAIASMASLPGAAIVRGASLAVASGGRLYRADSAGRIYVSDDGGQIWAVHTDFGSRYSIRRLTTDRADRLHAVLGFEGRTFELVLGRSLTSWFTA